MAMSMEEQRDRAIATEQSGGLEKPHAVPQPILERHADLSKFDEETRNRVLAALQGHHQFPAAAALAGIAASTLYAWVAHGITHLNEGVESEYATFAEAVEGALARSEGKLVKTVADSAQRGNVKDAQWLLERRHHKTWGKTDKVEHTGNAPGAVVIQLSWPSSNLSEAPSLGTGDDIVDAEVVDDSGS